MHETLPNSTALPTSLPVFNPSRCFAPRRIFVIVDRGELYFHFKSRRTFVSLQASCSKALSVIVREHLGHSGH